MATSPVSIGRQQSTVTPMAGVIPSSCKERTVTLIPLIVCASMALMVPSGARAWTHDTEKFIVEEFPTSQSINSYFIHNGYVEQPFDSIFIQNQKLKFANTLGGSLDAAIVAYKTPFPFLNTIFEANITFQTASRVRSGAGIAWDAWNADQTKHLEMGLSLQLDENVVRFSVRPQVGPVLVDLPLTLPFTLAFNTPYRLSLEHSHPLK